MSSGYIFLIFNYCDMKYNKKAFHYDAYRLLRWPQLDVSTGGRYTRYLPPQVYLPLDTSPMYSYLPPEYTYSPWVYLPPWIPIPWVYLPIWLYLPSPRIPNLPWIPTLPSDTYPLPAIPTLPRVYLPANRTWDQRYLPPEKDLGPEIPTPSPRRDLRPEIPTPPVERQTPVKTLASRNFVG